jgi:hypothetical protein
MALLIPAHRYHFGIRDKAGVVDTRDRCVRYQDCVALYTALDGVERVQLEPPPVTDCR